MGPRKFVPLRCRNAYAHRTSFGRLAALNRKRLMKTLNTVEPAGRSPEFPPNLKPSRYKNCYLASVYFQKIAPSLIENLSPSIELSL